MRISVTVLGRTIFCISILLVSFIPTSNAQQAKQDSLDQNYQRELPRIKPTEPGDALKTFKVADGYKIELAAAEPLVADPIAMAFDASGNLFVIEMRGYSENEKENLGRVRLLIDLDKDGKFDESYVYADGLSWPTAIACWDGGVFVGAAPDIFYFKDTNGDHKSDQKRNVFTGFKRSNVQGLMNTFRWSMDHRIEGATSSSGASVTNGDGSKIVLSGRDFAFDPKTAFNSKRRKMISVSGGGQHGWDFNQWGEKFVCSNSDHVQWVAYEDRYVARNPFVFAPRSRKSIASDGPQAEVFRISPVEPWRIVRTRLRVQKLVPGPVEGGGRAAGYFTGSTGLTIFRGSGWKNEHYGLAIVADVGSNLIHRKQLQRNGIEYRATRMDKASEFVASKDIWFRPVQFANGPDGALYVADMYREVIEHPKSLPPIIKKHLDLNSGRKRGRIYRIVRSDFVQPKIPDLQNASTLELVESLKTKNLWHRETASRLLHEKSSTTRIELLRKQLSSSKDAESIQWTLAALNETGKLTAKDLMPLLSHSSEHVKVAAIRTAEKMLDDSKYLFEGVAALSNDKSPIVRKQLAFSLGESSSNPNIPVALSKIIRHSSEDSASDQSWIKFAILTSVSKSSNKLIELLADETDSAKTYELIRELIRSDLSRQQTQKKILEIFAKLSLKHPKIFERLIVDLRIGKQSSIAADLSRISNGKSSEIIESTLSESKNVANAKTGAIGERISAINRLKIGDFKFNKPTIESLLQTDQPTAIQIAAIDLARSYATADSARLIIALYPSFTPKVKRSASDACFSRSNWAKLLLDDVRAGKIKKTELYVSAAASKSVRTELEKLFGAGNSDRKELVERYLKVVSRKGDTGRGQKVFVKHCASCHKIGNEGKEIGPNLLAATGRGSEFLITNIIDPNREVNPDFLTYLVTKDGVTHSGMISSESASTIELTTAENKRIEILRVDIEEMTNSGLSLMPEGLEKEIDTDAMVHLLQFLRDAAKAKNIKTEK